MNRSDDHIFRHATTIAEARMREARRAQSHEVFKAFAGVVRGVARRLRARSSQARRGS